MGSFKIHLALTVELWHKMTKRNNDIKKQVFEMCEGM